MTPTKDDLWLFLKHFFVLTFDLDSDSSQDKARILGLLQLAGKSRSRERAEGCWNSVFELISEGTARAQSIGPDEISKIAGQFFLNSGFPDTARSWLKKIRDHCQLTRTSIASTVGGVHLDRESLQIDCEELLKSEHFTLVVGPPGCGKSNLAIEAAENAFGTENVFCFNSEEFNFPHLNSALEAAGLSEISPTEWSYALPFKEKVILIDSLERVIQSLAGHAALDQLFRLMSEDRRWRIVATCRDYYLPHVLTK